MEALIIQDYLRCGGTEKHSVFLADYFNENGYKTEILTFRPGGILATKQSSTKHTWLQKNDYKLDWFAPRLLKTIQTESPRTILCMGRMANCYGGFIQQKFPEISVVTTVRTGRALPFLYKWSLKKSKKILVNTQWWQNELTKNGISKDKMHVVLNPLLTNFNKKDCNKLGKVLREEKRTKEKCCIFLCVQGFRKGKQHSKVIEVFSKLPKNLDWELWLAGDGKERKRCEKLVFQLGIEDKVSFFGYQADLRAFYGAADIAISCSKEDSLPNFLIEAQSAGVPVIAWNTKGTPETFINKETGILIDDCKLSTTSEACKFMIKNFTQRDSMGQAGYAHARAKFNTEAQAKKTLSLIKEIE